MRDNYLVHATSNLFRKSNDGQILERLADLETLVSELSPFEATNPRDIIYGVLALAKDTRSTGQRGARGKEPISTTATSGDMPATPEIPSPSHPRPSSNTRKRSSRGSASKAKRTRRNTSDTELGGASSGLVIPEHNSTNASSRVSTTGEIDSRVSTPREKYLVQRFMAKLKKRISEKAYDVDYNKSFFHVCKDFLMFVLKISDNLDILCRPWAPKNLVGEELPSWIPTVSGDGFGKRLDGSFMRINADPLVGGPGNGKRNYTASKKYPVVCKFGDWTKQ
jgi:hypothetical protein